MDNEMITSESYMDESELYGEMENVPAGIIGAFIGALLGAIVIIAIGRAGFVASIGGFVLAAATIKGYKLLSKKLSKKGIIICVVLMIITVFCAEAVNWSWIIYDDLIAEGYDASFTAIMFNLFALIGSADLWGEFAKDLLLVYAFTVWGAFPTIKRNYKERNVKKPDKNDYRNSESNIAKNAALLKEE
ncbi:hypothetical protein SAMN06296386_101281 [Lachnospiraceae bacterium]|nr:hypothetical protein SAMN06296386_101281 [Lachnospiraceae bacterium]